jgi:hypothetical protein
MQPNEYTNWAAKEVLSQIPEQRVRNDWIVSWSRTLNSIRTSDGIFELISTICARWEFLGGLYLGSTGSTDVQQAIAYVGRFLVPINGDYSRLHNMSGRAAGGSDFFTMFRNKTLHGGTPAAIALMGNASVVGWWIGFDELTQRNHLKIVNDNMHVNGDMSLCEFLSSLDAFAAYLEQNLDLLNGRLPSARWQRGFWARFRPLYFDQNVWIQEGGARRIPA